MPAEPLPPTDKGHLPRKEGFGLPRFHAREGSRVRRSPGLTCHQEGGAGAEEGVAGAKGMVNGGWGRGLGWQGVGGRDLRVTMKVGGTVKGWGGNQSGDELPRGVNSLLPPGQVSLRRKGLQGFPFQPGPTVCPPNRRQAAAGPAPSKPVGGEGSGVRCCPRRPQPPSGSSSPVLPSYHPPPEPVCPSPLLPSFPRPPPPPAAAAALAAASYAPEPSGRRGWAWGPPGLCLHTPDAQTSSPALGFCLGVPGLPLPGSRRPQLSLVRKRREVLLVGVGGWCGWEPGVSAQSAGGRASPPWRRVGLGRFKSRIGLAVMGSRDRYWDTPPSRGSQGSYLTRGQGAPNLRVTRHNLAPG